MFSIGHECRFHVTFLCTLKKMILKENFTYLYTVLLNTAAWILTSLLPHILTKKNYMESIFEYWCINSNFLSTRNFMIHPSINDTYIPAESFMLTYNVLIVQPHVTKTNCLLCHWVPIALHFLESDDDWNMVAVGK